MEPATIAGFVAAEQAVSTTLELGVPAAYGKTDLAICSALDDNTMY